MKYMEITCYLLHTIIENEGLIIQEPKTGRTKLLTYKVVYAQFIICSSLLALFSFISLIHYSYVMFFPDGTPFLLMGCIMLFMAEISFFLGWEREDPRKNLCPISNVVPSDLSFAFSGRWRRSPVVATIFRKGAHGNSKSMEIRCV
ncbi:hypothetical protein CEXT_224291 [Caerostris extrusa]|uniref:Uncharacterized protein n=1 Tax=Caerostris extrusa TaxID=172846 RepID=A0AAV4XD63_CAEEX|nr:hypothetical protein CEXT_224291 [Caerostris extrusa]